MNKQKEEVLRLLALREDADVIAISEAGFIQGGQVELENFEIIANQESDNATNYWFGGVALWLRKSPELRVMNFSKYVNDGFQAIQVLLENGVKIVAFYRSPNQDKEGIRKTAKFFRELTEETVIIGDLNVPEAEWAREDVSKADHRREKEILIRALTTKKGRRQVVDFNTRYKPDPETKLWNLEEGNLLDIVSGPMTADIRCNPVQGQPQYLSDHVWVNVELHNMSRTEGIAELYFESKKVDWRAAKNNMSVDRVFYGYFCGMGEGAENVETMNTKGVGENQCDVCNLLKEINTSIEKATKRRKKRNERMIVTDEILMMQIERVKEASEKRQEIRDRKHWDLFDRERKVLNRMLKDNKRVRELEFARKIKQDVNNIYKPFRNKENQAIKALRNENGELISDPEGVAEIYSEYISTLYGPDSGESPDMSPNEEGISMFYATKELVEEAVKTMSDSGSVDPTGLTKTAYKKLISTMVDTVTNVANNSFQQGIVPECLKIVTIELLKKARKDPEIAKNVRGINITPVLLKIAEKIAKDQMDDHYYKTDYYYRKQFGFRKKRSILTCLANIHNVIQRAKAKEQKMVMCVLDFSKAFDCLDIPTMLNSLHQSGIRGKALEWIDSWCRGNKYRVKVEGKFSKEKDITSGSKQGSSMGTGLFNVYVNDLLKQLDKETPKNIHIFAYADDITILQACEHGRDNVEEMQNLLGKCSTWSERTKLLFNVAKSFILHFGKPSIESEYYLMGDKLAITQETEVLGMVFNTDRKDMYEKNKKNLSNRTKFAVKKINDFMSRLTFLQWTMLWNSLVGGKLMAAGSELLVDYTLKGKTPHSNEFSYDYDTYPLWVKKLDTQYRNYFWNKKVPDTYTIEDIPLMPSQQLLSNAIKLVIKIDLGNYQQHGFELDEHLPLPDETVRVANRTSNLPRMVQSITRMSHDRDLSIVRKHYQAVSEFYKYMNMSREKLAKLNSKSLGKQVERFLKVSPNNLNLFRNQLLKNELQKPFGPYVLEKITGIVNHVELYTQ